MTKLSYNDGWGPGGIVSFAAGPWQSPSVGSRGKAPDLFMSGRVNNSLK